MCQLLGMNSRLPASLTLSFTGFAQRGGGTDHHSDGWGIAFFESDGDQPGKAAHEEAEERAQANTRGCAACRDRRKVTSQAYRPVAGGKARLARRPHSRGALLGEFPQATRH